MYEDYWNLEAKPFEPAAHGPFIFSHPGRNAALHKLRYAVESRRPAILLAGGSGTGKTLLRQTLCQQLGEAVGLATTFRFPLMSPREMLAYLADQISPRLASETSAPGSASIEESLLRIEAALLENHVRGKFALLAVDEAHLLEDAGLLDPLRLLLNLRDGEEPLFTLLLLGQIPAISMIERANALDDHVEMQILLKPFTAEETAGYIEHRLIAAGATRPLFTSDALEMVHQLTGGIARRINRLCDLALVVGFAGGESHIDADQLRSVQGELISLAAAA